MIKKELTKFVKMYLTGRRRRGRTQKGYILFLHRIHLPSRLRDVCFNVKVLVIKRAKEEFVIQFHVKLYKQKILKDQFKF